MMYRVPQWAMLTGAIATFVLIAVVIASQMGPSDPLQGGSASAEAPQKQAAANVNAQPKQAIEAQSNLPEVSVVTVSAGRYQATLESFGAVSARYSLEMQALVSGRVLSTNERFENGALINAGEVLVNIDPTDYQAAVASAKANLASAKVAFLEEERMAEQALIEWRDADLPGEPDSELVLRKPQLASAQASVKQAENALAVAERNLGYTNVSVPFDGVVVERMISPGSYVSAGASLGEVFDRTRAEIRVALSAKEWGSLPNEQELLSGEWPVLLQSVEDNGTWEGYVIRVEHHVEEDSRQRHLIVAVDRPLDEVTPLYPGTFVQAQMPGRSLDGLWQLPTSSLSQQSEVWYIGQQGTLNKFTANPVFTDKGHIYITPPSELQVGMAEVLTQPLSGYLPGMAVKPVNNVSSSTIQEQVHD